MAQHPIPTEWIGHVEPRRTGELWHVVRASGPGAQARRPGESVSSLSRKSYPSTWIPAAPPSLVALPCANDKAAAAPSRYPGSFRPYAVGGGVESAFPSQDKTRLLPDVSSPQCGLPVISKGTQAVRTVIVMVQKAPFIPLTRRHRALAAVTTSGHGLHVE